LLAEVWPEPCLRAAPERPELEHREDARAAPDALASVEDRRSARQEHEQGNGERDRKRQEQEQRREEHVEHAQDDVTRPRRRLERELAVAADERVLEPRRVGHADDRRADGRYKVALWIRASSLPSVPWSSAAASRRPPTSSA